MEEGLLKLPNNVPGRYYVSAKCDGCAYCAGVAPENFDFDKPSNTYFIGRQPETDEEIELVLEAMEDCPVDAITSVVVSCSSSVTLN
jgi:ferredoxin